VNYLRFLTPTENKRLNELIGFLCITASVLTALALISYSPTDASWNVSSAPEGAGTGNWIGPAGAYSSDLLFQVFGFAAFLLPMGLSVLGWRWLRSRPIDSQIATVVGYGLLLLSLPSLLTLWHFPDVRGSVPPGGMLGSLVSGGLRSGFNPIGANLVAVALLLTALFMTTRFSFTGAHAWASGPKGPIGAVEKLGILQKVQARWHAWRGTREQERLRKRLAETRLSGRKPVTPQSVGNASGLNENPAAIELEDESDVFKARQEERDEERKERDKNHKAPIFVMDREPEKPGAKKSAEPKIAKGTTNYKLPSVSLLREGERSQKLDETELKERARAIEAKCQEFDVQGRVTQINPGPVVTTFEFKPEAGIKYSRIIGLTEDLCLALQAESILIERIPGKSTIGIEVPNLNRQTIALREIIEAPEFINSPSKLTLAMGRDLHGRIRITDLASMPHLLIAGSTGTGKSVFINSLMMSILYKASPDDVKMVLVDPKRLELNLYENIPHLIAPVVTDPKIASNVLRNATREMENRLKLLAQRGVRNIDQYNRTFQKQQSLSLFDNVAESEHKPLPYLVIVIDELADLMMVDTNNVEESITRLAQMARAVGIHLILATQRPSVDVITGLIKANFPARISFRVASKVDSRTILDANGSESLLGNGDMLYLPAGSARLHRIHGPLVTEDEIVSVCDFWRQQAQAKYNEQLLEAPKDENGKVEVSAGSEEAEDGADDVDDALYQDAIRVVCDAGRASTSTLQRRLRIGYGRAARLIDLMEKDGIVGPPEGTKPREVLKNRNWMREFDQSAQE
jgi:S-DNA-T family DNA segregation ATPase FtsK/SpoIIIE